jgi:hypothetical protein
MWSFVSFGKTTRLTTSSTNPIASAGTPYAEHPGNRLKRVLRHQILNFAALANNDLGDKRKFACHFGACLDLGHWLPNDECTRRANVDGTEVLQSFGQLGRSESPVATDVNSSQKNNEGHSNPSTDP